MNIIGIVCEYNPFHKGHTWQIESSREALGQDSLVICVMSGDYVQRGEAAIFSKFARAEAACRCGADLVFELPLPWALASAEGFARGAVSMLASLGCTHLSFGSEHGMLDKLELLAQRLSDADTASEIKSFMSQNPNLSFAAARQKLMEKELGDTAELLDRPNNILAVEYLKAIKQLGLPLKPYTVKRKGSGHDQKGEGELRSASELRDMLRRGESPWEHIPAGAKEVFSREIEQGRVLLNQREQELVIMSRLRMMGEDMFHNLPDGGSGAGQRLYNCVKTCSSMDELIECASTKRIARARVRRMCLAAALGVDGNDAKVLPPYARLLAAGAGGRSFLRAVEGKTAIPVLTKPAAVRALGDEALRVFAMGASAHDMYSLLYLCTEDRIGGQDWKTGPKIV